MLRADSSTTSQESQVRAGVYAVLAQFFLAPDRVPIPWLADWPGADAQDDLSLAWSSVVAAMRRPGAAQALEAAHAALFVAAGSPDLNPYASAYLDSGPMDFSLAQLRSDLKALGLQRVEGAREPEDHIGALLEAMQVLVARGAPLAEQGRFIDRHLAPWAARCFSDVAAHPQAGPYAPLANFAGLFLAAEQEALAEERSAA